MWRMSERSGCGQYLKRITFYLRLQKKKILKYTLMCFSYMFMTRKMVPITGRARSFLLVFKNKIERRGGDRIKTTGLSIYPML